MFYYVTVMNENYAQPSLPAGAEDDIIRGMYRLAAPRRRARRSRIRLLGSGAILREVIAAARPAARRTGTSPREVWSATSFSELAREAREVERWNRLHPASDAAHEPSSRRCLPGRAPVIAATDYVRAYPQLIASYVEGRFVALGTDGFGRSDTRAALRSFFEVDRPQIVLAALAALAAEGRLDRKIMAAAIRRYGIDPERPASWTC